MSYPAFCLIALALIVVGAGMCLFAAHLPGLRRLTGAAPLEFDPAPLLAADAPAEQVAVASLARDRALGHAETDDQWAARALKGGA